MVPGTLDAAGAGPVPCRNSVETSWLPAARFLGLARLLQTRGFPHLRKA